MNRCKWCNASGWIHALTENGLCKDCNLLVVNRAQIHARIIRRSLQELEEADVLDTKMRLCKRIEEEARALSQFEEKDIETVNPNPKEIVKVYSTHYNKLHALRNSERNLRQTTPQISEPSITSIDIAGSMDPLDAWKEPVPVQH